MGLRLLPRSSRLRTTPGGPVGRPTTITHSNWGKQCHLQLLHRPNRIPPRRPRNRPTICSPASAASVENQNSATAPMAAPGARPRSRSTRARKGPDLARPEGLRAATGCRRLGRARPAGAGRVEEGPEDQRARQVVLRQARLQRQAVRRLGPRAVSHPDARRRRTEAASDGNGHDAELEALLNYVIPPAIQSKHAGKKLGEVSAQVVEWYATKMAVTTPESQVLKDKAAALLARQLQPA